MKIPFGIAQIGKAFRNEIVARQFIFRMREFEQMEMQFFEEIRKNEDEGDEEQPLTGRGKQGEGSTATSIPTEIWNPVCLSIIRMPIYTITPCLNVFSSPFIFGSAGNG